MRIIHENVAGLDVHKKVVVAAVIVKQVDGSWLEDKRSFGTMTADLLALSDWLLLHGVTHVAMESTGEYWKPVFNILENNFEVMVVNAQHISKVPGRKTDQSDAQWIAELLQYGLLKASFIPPLGQRELCANEQRWSTECRRFWRAPTSSFPVSPPTSWVYRDGRCWKR